MATFTTVVTFTFDAEYEVEADTYENAEEQALSQAEEWKPYSSDKGVTYDWIDVEVEVSTEDELEDE